MTNVQLTRIEWTHDGSRMTARAIAEVGRPLRFWRINRKTGREGPEEQGSEVLWIKEPTHPTGPYVVRIEYVPRSVWNNEIMIRRDTVIARSRAS